MRDAVDCRNALQLPFFQSPQIFDPFSEEVAMLCKNKLKLHKVPHENTWRDLNLKAYSSKLDFIA